MMQVDLEGFAANVKRAMGSRDTHGWGHTLDELIKHVQQLENDVECYEGMKEGVTIRVHDAERDRDAWRKAARLLYDAFREGGSKGRPMDMISKTEWRGIVEAIAAAETQVLP